MGLGTAIVNAAQFNYIIRFGSLIVDLHQLLGMPIFQRDLSQLSAADIRALTPIEKNVYSIWLYNARGEIDKRDIQLAIMHTLVRNIKVIRFYKPALFRRFKREIKRAGTNDSFFGIRFEVAISEVLIGNSIEFRKTESPDFTIPTDTHEVFIECGSCRIRKENKGAVEYKIRSAIKEKSKKPYANKRTALLIDITNLAYNVAGTDHQFTPNKLREVALSEIEESGYGAIALSCFMFNRKSNEYECNYIRAKSMTIDVKLNEVLGRIFPGGQHQVERFVVPAEG